MARRRMPRFSREAERALIGAVLLRADLAVPAAKDQIDSSSFFDRTLGLCWSLLVEMWGHGEKCDAVTLCDRIVKVDETMDRDSTLALLYDLQASTPAISNAGHYAGIIAEHALARDLQALATTVAEELYDESLDPTHALDELRSRLVGMGITSTSEPPSDLYSVDEWMLRTEEDRGPWIIPGLMRARWRAILVAGEGTGKTVLTRQLAMCVAQGIHPLTYRPMTPYQTLMMDFENPSEAIDEQIELVQDKLRRMAGLTYAPDRCYLWARPAGIDIRTRTDRAEFENAIAAVRPGLVCISPLYKVFRTRANENEERATQEVMEILGDLIHRYGFALLIEHHAPKGMMNARDFFPSGSSLWLRWPEFGLGMKERKGDDEGRVWDLQRWRGDRLRNSWPDAFERGRSGEWPWQGVWNRPGDMPGAINEENF